MIVRKKITILHNRPKYDNRVKFIYSYEVEINDNSKIDLTRLFRESFNEAHPTWSILKINVRDL